MSTTIKYERVVLFEDTEEKSVSFPLALFELDVPARIKMIPNVNRMIFGIKITTEEGYTHTSRFNNREEMEKSYKEWTKPKPKPRLKKIRVTETHIVEVDADKTFDDINEDLSIGTLILDENTFDGWDFYNEEMQ